jgi:hypothetical protein
MLARGSPLFPRKARLALEGKLLLTFDLCRRCWFPANPNDPSTSGEIWISGTVTKKTVDRNGENVTLVFEDERGEV